MSNKCTVPYDAERSSGEVFMRCHKFTEKVENILFQNDQWKITQLKKLRFLFICLCKIAYRTVPGYEPLP